MMTPISFARLLAARTPRLWKSWHGVVLLACALAVCLPPSASHAAPRHHSSSPQIISGLNGRVRLLVPRGSASLNIVPAKPSFVPRDMIAVPGTGFEVIGVSSRADSNAYVTVSMTARNYADTAVYRQIVTVSMTARNHTAVYRQMRVRWLRLPTFQRFRSGHTLSMSARLYRLVPRARYAVLARRTSARPLQIAPIRPERHKHDKRRKRPVPPNVGMSPPIHVGP